MIIRPLSNNDLEAAIKLANSVFPREAKEYISPEKSFLASLKPKEYGDFYNTLKLKDAEYFVGIDKDMDAVIGITGLYYKILDPDNAWLGWFCVDPAYREKGFGEKLLEWTINKAKEGKYRSLRLYTSTDPNESVAQKLYEKLGFEISDEAKLPKEMVEEVRNPKSKYKIFFRELKF